jgi:DNA transformation protein
MASQAGYPEHVLDLLVQLGPPFDTGTRLRRMFGGHGIFCDGVMFALIADDVLFLKVDDTTKPDFLTAGCVPFIYEKTGKPVEMSYVTVPEDANENVEELRPWAHLALAAANRAHAAKKGKGP